MPWELAGPVAGRLPSQKEKTKVCALIKQKESDYEILDSGLGLLTAVGILLGRSEGCAVGDVGLKQKQEIEKPSRQIKDCNHYQ